MAASSSGSVSVCGSYQRVSDAIYEIHRPVSGEITLELIFFHGYVWNDCEEAHIQTWMLRDNSACWLGTLLVQQFPQARVLSVAYDASLKVSPSHGRMDMHLTGEYLAQSLIHFGNIGQHWPVVLVGHCVGGLVMKEVCLQVQRQRANTKSGIRKYSNFLRNLRGLFFYGTPQQGSRMCLGGSSKPINPILEYMQLLSADSARINAAFANLRIQYGWKTFGVMETDETQVRSRSIIRNLWKLWEWVPEYSPRDSFQLVEEASARPDMDDFCAIRGVNHFTICKPEDKTSDSFQHLVRFLKTICLEEESRKVGLENHLGLPDGIIEFGDRISEFMEAFKLPEAGPKQILLVGMSGLGKSTIAKQVLMKIHSQFDYVCFVEILQETLSRKDFWKLVVGNLYQGNGKQASVEVQDEWGTLKLLQGKKLLLMLDDCDNAADMTNHLKGLSCGEGSRLVVTSDIQKDRSGFVKHVLPFLSHDDALTLFKARVRSPTLEAIPKELVEQIVGTCEGLPLTLDVIGSFLRGRNNEKIWKSTLGRLLEAGCIDGTKQDRLWERLRVSFDSLGDEEKAIFLDLASFDMVHRQYDLTLFESAWEESGWGMSMDLSLINLVERSFIQIRIVKQQDPYPVAYIHRQMRDMGRRISRPPQGKVESWRGVWQPRDVEDILTKYKGTTTNGELNVLSMCISDSVAVNPSKVSKLRMKNTCFDGRLSNLQSVRLLRMSDLNLIDSHQASRFPWALIMLHMCNCSRDEWKDSWLADVCWPIREEDVGNLHRLAVLIFDHCCGLILPSNIHECDHLKFIVIHSTDLTRLPRDFGLLPCLERLDLQDVQIAELPVSILELSSLRDLRLVDCLNFKSWPQKPMHVPNQLNSLTTLHLEHLPALSELPDGFGIFPSLTKLTIVNLPALRKVPESFGAMQSLVILELIGCDALKRLPDRFGDLRRLETLQIYACKRLESLGESFGGLCALKDLSLSKLDALEELPHTIGQLASLETVTLFSCSKLTMLPESFGKLELLREIDVRHCHSLVHLWEDPKPGEYGSSGETRNTLINLQRLDVYDCSKFQALSQSLGQLTCLDYLYLAGYKTFQCPPSSLRRLKRLKHLTIGRKVVPEDTKWKHGQTENLEPQSIGDDDESPGETDLFPAKLGWVSGPTFEFLGDLTSLEHLRIVYWSSGVKLPECLSQLMFLRTLEVFNCINIPESIGQLKALTKLSVNGTFTRLPTGVGELKSLESLILTGGRFKELPVSLGQLAALRTLELRQCEYLTHLPDSLGQLTNLRRLKCSECKSLKTIPHSLGLLTSLGELIINGCVSLVNDQTNTNFRGQLKSLWELTIRNCVLLHSLPDFLFDLISLRQLKVEGCMFLDIIPVSLGQLDTLEELVIKRSLSNNLVVDPLRYSSLRSLTIQDCVSVNNLPDSIGQLSFLESLHIRGCGSIKDFPDLLQVTSLKYFTIEGCPSLVVLPNSIGQLASLVEFTIKECVSLISIPDPLHLVSLKYLAIEGCTSLTTMPNSVGQLKSLTDLIIKDCTTISSLPDSLGQLASLKVLNTKGCISLKNLPTSMGQLRLLETLSLSGCFDHLPEWLGRFVALKVLKVQRCDHLKYLPESLGHLTALSCLQIVKCEALENLPASLGQLSSLRVLNTMGCTSIKNLPTSMGQLRLLHRLTLSGCFEDLPEWVGQFVALEDLGLQHCDRLRYLPESLGQLIALRYLEIVECKALENLPDSLGQLTSLEWLTVKECVSLKTIPDKLEELNSLNSLVIKRAVPESVNKVPECLGQLACSELGPFASLPTSLRQLTCLKKLTLTGENFAHLPHWLWQMPALTDLTLQQCDHLSHMPDVSSLGQVITLKSLRIIECKTLKNLPESIGNIAALRTLVIKGCISLENIPDSLGQLAHLTDLHIEGCVGVKTIPDSLRQLHDLKSLYVDAYLAIQVTSVGQLRSLKWLTVAGEYSEDLLGAFKLAPFAALNALRLLRCDYLMHLPDFLRSTSLAELFIGDDLFLAHDYWANFVRFQLDKSARLARKKLGPRQRLEIHDLDLYGQSTCFPESMEQPMSLKYVHVTGQASLRVLESLWRLQSKIITS